MFQFLIRNLYFEKLPHPIPSYKLMFKKRNNSKKTDLNK